MFTGIPGILPMQIPDLNVKKASQKKKDLLWDPERPNKLEYGRVNMKMEGVPKNYGEKNRRKVDREAKLERKKSNEKAMMKERKKERIALKEAKKDRLDKERKERIAKKLRIQARKQSTEKKTKENKKKNAVVNDKQERKERKERNKIRREKKRLKEERRKRKADRKTIRKARVNTITGIKPMALV